MDILDMTPINALTGKPYSGGNVSELLSAMEEYGFTQPHFLTFKQALEMGRVVMKGQKAAAFIRKVVTFTHKAKTKSGKAREGKAVRGYAVFNIEQTAPMEPAPQP